MGYFSTITVFHGCAEVLFSLISSVNVSPGANRIGSTTPFRVKCQFSKPVCETVIETGVSDGTSR
jgi:hypothetical protein